MSAQSIAKKYRPGPWVSLVHWLVHWFQGQTRESSIKGLWRVYRAVRRWYPDRDVICPTNYGFGLIINPAGDDYQIKLFETGAYEPGTLALMAKLLHPGDVLGCRCEYLAHDPGGRKGGRSIWRRLRL